MWRSCGLAVLWERIYSNFIIWRSIYKLMMEDGCDYE